MRIATPDFHHLLFAGFYRRTRYSCWRFNIGTR
jgi:hypothetical protein